MEASSLVVGIDLGTTNSCIAVKRNGKIEVIPNSEGKRTTLSYVYYDQRGPIVGKSGKHESARNPTNGIYEIKRLIGCFHDDPDVESEKQWLSYNLIRGINGEVKIELNQNGKKTYKLPEEICARILYKLKVDCESYLGQKIQKAVITVPAYFNNNQRAATRDAARLAGLEVVKLINEPSAAALAYINENPKRNSRIILIYDLGGGTFDVSILKNENLRIAVLSVSGDTHLGGQDFTRRLVHYVADEIENKTKFPIRSNKRLMRKLFDWCETAKKILSNSHETIVAPELPIDQDFCITISRAKFEELNRDLFEKTIRIVDKCINNYRLSNDDISEVLLVGGASRIPKIESLLKQYFGNKIIQRNLNADEAIAIGAAIEADFVKDFQNSSMLTDVLPLSIGTVVDNEPIFFHFARNTPLPATTKYKFSLKPDQKQGILSFYEGSSLDCAKNVFLGACEVKWESVNGGRRNIEIQIFVNMSGLIRTVAKSDTIKAFQIALNRGRLEEEEIERIKKEIINEYR